MSAAEREVRRRITDNAQLQRRRQSPGKGKDEPAGKLVKNADVRRSLTQARRVFFLFPLWWYT